MPAYAIAHNLIGFASTTLRVKIDRIEGEYVWVTTADLLDAGTKLVLDAGQVEYEDTTSDLMYKHGLVIFASA